jgi:hypothetical protein
MALRLRMRARGVRSASNGLWASSGCLRAQTGSMRPGSILWSTLLSCEDSETLARVVLVRRTQGARRKLRTSWKSKTAFFQRP